MNSIRNRKLDNVNLIVLAQFKHSTKYGFMIVLKELLRRSFAEAKTKQLEGKTAQNLDLDCNFFGHSL